MKLMIMVDDDMHKRNHCQIKWCDCLYFVTFYFIRYSVFMKDIQYSMVQPWILIIYLDQFFCCCFLNHFFIFSFFFFCKIFLFFLLFFSIFFIFFKYLFFPMPQSNLSNLLHILFLKRCLWKASSRVNGVSLQRWSKCWD